MGEDGFDYSKYAEAAKNDDQTKKEPDFSTYDKKNLREFRKLLNNQRGRLIRKQRIAEKNGDTEEIERIKKDLAPIDDYLREIKKYLDLL